MNMCSHYYVTLNKLYLPGLLLYCPGNHRIRDARPLFAILRQAQDDKCHGERSTELTPKACRTIPPFVKGRIGGIL